MARHGALALALGLALAALLASPGAPGSADAALLGLPGFGGDGDDATAAAAPADDYTENELPYYLNPSKRACIRRGGNCDHRPNDCCFNSSCRCNLWGSNCRCQRMGLFQKWGRK